MSAPFVLRFVKFDRETGAQIGDVYDMADHGHPDITAARKRLRQVNDDEHNDCFVDLASQWAVQTVEIVAVQP